MPDKDGPSLAEIMEAIGSLKEGFRGVNQRLDKADESRKELYGKVNEQTKAIVELQSDVKVAAKEAETARVEVREARTEVTTLIDTLKPLTDLKSDIPEMVEGWKDLKKVGQRIVWLLGIGGISVVAFAMWAGQLITEWVRHWLGIVPPPP